MLSISAVRKQIPLLILGGKSLSHNPDAIMGKNICSGNDQKLEPSKGWLTPESWAGAGGGGRGSRSTASGNLDDFISVSMAGAVIGPELVLKQYLLNA